MMLTIEKQLLQAKEWFLKAAAQNNAVAQTNIGTLYEDGHGVQQDYKQAMEWYLKAAAQKHIFAQYFIAKLYNDGLGVKKNKNEAEKWNKRAADNVSSSLNFNDLNSSP